MRLFVAIELPEPARAAIARFVDLVRPELERHPLRWVPPANLHLTLAFLGETADERVADVVAAIDAAAAPTPPLALHLSGAGRFSSAAWVGLAGDTDALGLLAKRLAVGLGTEDRFHPHVTIGRFRDPRRSRRVAIPSADALEPVPFVARDAVLYRSDAQPIGPPVYVVLHRASFTSARTSDDDR